MGDYEPLLRWQREPRGPNEVDRIDLSPPPLLHYSPNTRSPYLPDYSHTPALDGFLGSPAFRPSRLSNSPGASVLFSPMDIDVSRSPSTPSIYQDNELVSPSPSLTALQPDQIGSPRWEGASYLVDLSVSEGTPIPPSVSSSPLEVLADIQNNDIHDSPNSVYYTPLQSPLLGSPLTVAAPVLNGARTTAQIKKRRKQEVFICPIPGCGRTFSRNINLTVHIRLHKEEKPLVCRWPECGRGFSRYHDLQLHEQSHAGLQSLECKGCRKIFTHVDALKQHLFSEEGTICLKLHVFLHLRRDGDGAGQDYAAQINQYINHISAESPDSRYASLTNLRDLRESICSMIIKIAGDRELRKQFIDVFSAQERRPEAQGISNCVNSILYEESFNNANDHANVLRLLCKFQGAAQVYPDRYLLSDISMAPLPFQGGGFADTFEGKHKDKRICIKMIRVFDKEPQVKLLKELARETTLWAHMSHENILPFYGTYVSDRATSRICLVSPFMKNGNLETFLRNNPTTPRLPLVQDVIEGLRYLHHSKIVHGDLKAQNVLVSDDGRGLITDFGLSYIAMTAAVGSTEITPACTLHWTAPELACAAVPTKPTKPSDIWSFGCLCYEVYTGRSPYYQCRLPAQVIFALMRSETPTRPTAEDSVSGELDDWIWEIMEKGCWKIDPQDRNTCDEIRDALATRPTRKYMAINPQDQQKSSFWAAMKEQSESKIDYSEVKRILDRFFRLPCTNL